MPRVPRIKVSAKQPPQVSIQSPPKASPLAYEHKAPPPRPIPIDPSIVLRKNAARITRHRSIAIVCAGFTASAVAFYIGQLYVNTTRPARLGFSGPTSQSDLIQVYDRTASSFDTDVALSERLMGVTSLRRSLALQCRGDVLEVSAGTGRNLGYYKAGAPGRGVESLTLVDLSGEMLEEAKKKWIALKLGGEAMGLRNVPVRFYKGDCVGQMLPPPPPPSPQPLLATEEGKAESENELHVAKMGRRKDGYDTVIQTLGFCSTDQPVEMLQNMAKQLNPSNPNATILLMEHGRSYYDWLNDILDKQAPQHADKHGCWWNRDIGEIVRKSGLEIVKEKRKHLGTTWLYELKPGEKTREAEKNETPSAEIETSKQEQERSSPYSWLPRWTYEKICR